MREIEDFREASDYDLAEIITASLAMFLFKTGSRNEFNNLSTDGNFQKNYEKLFGFMPHLDTVHNVMKRLEEKHLEKLKRRMIKELLDRKCLYKYRFRKQYIVAVDGTGVASFGHKHCDQCLHKTSKKGKTTWFHNVLEAKLITPNGFALSIGTQWIENPIDEYKKQDCERKAFQRLAEKIKKDYPRLRICLTADSLYPYQGFFDICKTYNWHYILTFKDNCLPSISSKADKLKESHPQNRRNEVKVIDAKERKQKYSWVTDMDYHGHTVHWFECLETVDTKDGDQTTRYVHLTDIKPDFHTTPDLSATGRMRWKIENEGFNIQKNHGYKLEHKYARKSYRAMKNYYQIMQIAHMINELVVLNTSFQKFLVDKMTVKHIWLNLTGFMIYGDIDDQGLRAIDAVSLRVSFVT